MLIQLSIRDIVLIERLDIGFREGLSVLTGETGAGKSILLDALSLALGGRGDAGLVRHGVTQGQVMAVFDVAASHPARALLTQNGVDDDGDIILRRTQSADGRTRVFINDQPASAALMREVGRLLVEIHGQHDDRALIDAEMHRALLDAHGGLTNEAAHVRSLHATWRGAERALGAHRARVEAAAREADFLRAAVDELSRLNPMPGEEENLADKRTRMMRSEKIAADITEANEILNGSGSPTPSVSGLLRRLERKAAELPGLLDDTVAALSAAVHGLADASSAIERAMHAIEFDPRELERTEERLFALRAAARKFSVAVDDLAALAVTQADDLAELDAGEARLAALEAEARASAQAYDRAAAALSEHRTHAAASLQSAVMAELPALKLERAAFFAHIETDGEDRRPEGIDRVEFWVRTNPGSRPGPMMKVASGGELSRFLLALKVVLAEKTSAPTLVFDEIDTGVGGAVADAIGARLKRLSGNVQVLSVTHAPQVAARADTHFLIAKNARSEAETSGEDAIVVTTVAEMDVSARREEIARMLAGATITEEARAAAGRLLAGAG